MTHIIVLAGGKGVRMKSDSPKVLIEAKGKALIEHLLNNIEPACARPTIVVGYKGEEVIAHLGADRYEYVWQKEQLGTGHAVAAAKANLSGKNFESIVVLYGDHPRVTATTVSTLIEARIKNDATIGMGTIVIPNYEGDYKLFDRFSRVLRDEKGEVIGSVEFKDASDLEREITEVNPSYYCFDAEWLWNNIDSLENRNASGEYYLPDLVKRAFDQAKKVVAVPVDPVEGMGANTPEELEIISRYLK
jgi:bifunctional UDP-N-acetylglucosamine pyrophosphorylase / glucosamine-1-phosphate N-acetyltransferase